MKYNSILNRLPQINKINEIYLHREVHSLERVYVLYPKGKKYLYWFTYENDKNICLELELDKKNEIIHLNKSFTSFNPNLSLGTLISGIQIYKNKQKCFIIDDIYYYLGKDIQNQKYNIKLSLIYDLLNTYICKKIYHVNQTYFCLPIICANMNSIMMEKYNCNYDFNEKFILTLGLNSFQKKIWIPMPKNSNHAIFQIQPLDQCDSYQLMVYDNKSFKKYGYAFIDSFKKSIFMNDLFHPQKSNYDLDLIEMSDDEEESQKENNKSKNYPTKLLFICKWNYKNKKWCPLNTAPSNSKPTTLEEIKNIEKNI